MCQLVVLGFAAVEEALLAHVKVEAFQAAVSVEDKIILIENRWLDGGNGNKT